MKWSSRTGVDSPDREAPATDGLRAWWFLAPSRVRASPARSKFLSLSPGEC
ncbi:hypothetical protein F750_4005 [Streptomyces sp. PAMC 26508]|nr:hypothetical protein F750_4005 [Streptomyces sp. PAMC 26508]